MQIWIKYRLNQNSSEVKSETRNLTKKRHTDGFINLQIYRQKLPLIYGPIIRIPD